MRIKLVILGTVIAILSSFSALVLKADTSQSTNTSHPSSIETINGMPVQRLQASFIAPSDVEGLIKESDLIVIGKVGQSLEEAEPLISRDADGEVSSAVSLVKMTVKKVFKGDANLKNQTIKIGQSIAILSDKTGKPYVRSVENVQPFQKGRYLLFLKKGIGVDAYFPTGLFYGRHNIDKTDNSEENIDSPSYQTIRKTVRQQFKDDNT